MNELAIVALCALAATALVEGATWLYVRHLERCGFKMRWTFEERVEHQKLLRQIRNSERRQRVLTRMRAKRRAESA